MNKIDNKACGVFRVKKEKNIRVPYEHQVDAMSAKKV